VCSSDLGLDLARYRADLTAPEVAAAVDRDLADGKALGVTGTPTLFVDGERFSPTGGDYPAIAAELRSELDAALAR
jgi:protein-disulfide isomerase